MDAHDVLVLGTGLPEAVLSAALSRAGKKVLHVDTHDYYGSSWASLTLKELLTWAEQHGAHLAFPRDGSLTEALAQRDRHYSLSLRPTLLPAHGPMLNALKRSSVASYATFRLLDRIGVYDASTRRLERVPSSKSEIFRHKTISLADKRRLMRFLELARAAPPDAPLAHVLEGLQLAPPLQEAVQYGVCLAWNKTEQAPTALARTRQALAGLGRYGDAAYLVGQYGGAGELAQGFCRASAVQGATFVLGHKITSLTHKEGQWEVRMEGIDEPFAAAQLACSAEAFAEATGKGALQKPPAATYEHLALVITDAPIDWERIGQEVATLETALLVFPPGTTASEPNAVLVLMQGEGTFSCPKGQYVYYLMTYAENDAAHNLQETVDRLVALLAPPTHADGEEPAPPLLTLFWARPIDASMAHDPAPMFVDPNAPCTEDRRSSVFLEPRGPFQAVPNLTETLDQAVEAAEQAFWKLYTPEARQAAYDVAFARAAHHDPADYQGRGGAEPDLAQAPPTTEVEFLAPTEDTA